MNNNKVLESLNKILEHELAGVVNTLIMPLWFKGPIVSAL